MLKKAALRLQQHRGQMVIMFVGIFTLTAIAGVMVLDFGLWLSERRTAQTDADMSALAGAQAYIADLTNTSGAFDDAVDWAVANGILEDEIDPSPTSDCSGDNSCIDVGLGNCHENGTDTSMPWVESTMRHEVFGMFTRFFGWAVPDIGAQARACVGSPRTVLNVDPIGVQTGFVDDPDCPNYGEPLSPCLEPDTENPGQTRPVYGSVCILKTGAQSDRCAGFYGGQRGQLTLGELDCEQKSASTLKHDFHYGTLAGCSVDQDVNTGTGNIIGLLTGLNERLTDELLYGRCDDLFHTGNPGYDDFDEVFSLVEATPSPPGTPITPSADNVFSLNDCAITTGQDGVPPCPEAGHVHTYMPRVLDLVLIDRLEQGAQTATITGFAGFYVIGCFDDAVAEQTKAAIELDLTNFDSYLNRCDHPTGHDDILGIFVEELAPPVDVGDPDPNLPLSIVLVK